MISKIIESVARMLLILAFIGIFFVSVAKPKEVAGYFDPIVYYSDIIFVRTGEKKCKMVKAGNQQGKLKKVNCSVFTAMQLAEMQWKPAK